ncbi:MAG: aldehyde:ferredoxin oxidoreductase [Firmicutes bacterium]|nr:aldehyde:ferredoxin oxidoreductase [Bacillota bacterium]
MRYAETGYNLEIDLSRGNIERVETDPKTAEQYLGGLGSNFKIMWDRVPAEVDAFDPENLLIFSSALLVGTAAPGANRTIITTVSPQTKLMGFSMMGGFISGELKNAGYDKVIFRGKSPNLVYLWINNDKVELRDASHLKGKGTHETAEIIRRELNEPKAQVAAIGLAGENRVFYASIEHDKSSASRLGTGAVMGDKGIKAIVVRGTKDVNIARPEEFGKLCQELIEAIPIRHNAPVKDYPACMNRLGSPQEMREYEEAWHMNNFPWGNGRERRPGYWTPEVDQYHKEIMGARVEKFIGCYNCPMACGGLIAVPGKPKFGMKCFTRLTYTMAAYSGDMDFDFTIAQLATEYGVDGFTAPQVMAFAVELYEDGILTDEDMPGFPTGNKETGNEERFFWLLDKIARREGVGDALADGTYWAARRIGKGAEAYAHNTIKKLEQVGAKTGMLNPLYFLMYGTGEKSNIVQIEGQWPQMPYPDIKDREDFVKDWIQVPDEKFKQYFLEWEPRTFPFQPGIEACCDIVDWMEMIHYIDDSLGICAGLSAFNLKPPYHVHNFPLFISAATGIDMDEPGLKKTIKRIRTLIRAINVRRGLRRSDDLPPPDQWKKRFPEYEEKLLTAYYKFKGWNEEGIPTKESLHELGLDFVSNDLEQRGIIK